MSAEFSSLGLHDALGAALGKQGITSPFPIQTATIPDVLAGRDVSGKAPTGSGKTLAFGLPLLSRVERARPNLPTSLILAPTRELAEQIHQELTPLAGAVQRRVTAVYGGVGYGPQISALRRGVDVLVATPGRLEDLIEKGVLKLQEASLVVIDEADRMADMGFLPAVRRILDKTAPRRQTLLFSATLDGDVAQLSRDYQDSPIVHEAASIEPHTVDASHHFWLVTHEDRVQHTADIISATGKTIVFTRTRHGADRLAKQLGRLDVSAVAMHGGRNQNQRNRALRSFTSGSAQALVATDVAARGIHVDDVSAVIHFDPAGDSKDYVHRSGRTGRAGAGGSVVSLVKNDQRRSVMNMQRRLGMESHVGKPDHRELSKPSNRPSEAPSNPHQERRRPTETGATTSIYVGNLPWSTTRADLMRLFGEHGQVINASVATRRGKSKGYGFVEMPTDSARAAIAGMRGSSVSGRTLNVRKARPPVRS